MHIFSARRRRLASSFSPTRDFQGSSGARYSVRSRLAAFPGWRLPRLQRPRHPASRRGRQGKAPRRTDRTRPPDFADVPLLKEIYPSPDFALWFGIFALPRHTCLNR